jgi:hypothetical protein
MQLEHQPQRKSAQHELLLKKHDSDLLALRRDLVQANLVQMLVVA